MPTSKPGIGEATLQAIKCLKPSGPQSFEKLTADLLSRLIGVTIRLCKAGYQAGMDAISEEGIPFAIEDKRYNDANLDLRELEGELAAASRSYPDLQLWVLATTTNLASFDQNRLNKTAETQGLAVLILDKTAAAPELPNLSSIEALCAINVEATMKALKNRDWLDSKKLNDLPSFTDIEADLRAIAEIPHFNDWMAHLRQKFEGLPIWQLVVERQNRRVTKILKKDAFISLGTAFDPNQVISRTAKTKIDDCKDIRDASELHQFPVGKEQRGYISTSWHGEYPCDHQNLFSEYAGTETTKR